MRNILFLLVFISQVSFAQRNLTEQQKYFIQEWNDAYGGQIQYADNYFKTSKIYNELADFSKMKYPVIFNQTFQWGQAHYGGLIILDYSTINKDENILAFMFSHEWGHQALGHQPNLYNPNGSIWKIKTHSTQFEDEADYYAGQFIKKYNYDIDVIIGFLESLPNFNDHTHSSGLERARLVLDGYNSITYNKVKNKEPEIIVDYYSVFGDSFNANNNDWTVGHVYKKNTDLDFIRNVYYKIEGGKYKIRNLGNIIEAIGYEQLSFRVDSDFEISIVAYLYSGSFSIQWAGKSACENELKVYSSGKYEIWKTTSCSEDKLSSEHDVTSGQFVAATSNRIKLKIKYSDGYFDYYINDLIISGFPAEIFGNETNLSIGTGSDLAIDNILILKK